jgi:hypothetical protein
MSTQSEDCAAKWELLVADMWADPGLKRRLMEDPASVLRERGIQTSGKQIKIVEDTDKIEHLVIPSKPSGGELSEEELQSVAGGHCGGCGGCGCGRGCGGCGCGGCGCGGCGCGRGCGCGGCGCGRR